MSNKYDLPEHECPIDGCDMVCVFPMLMCAGHWRRTPKDTRERAWKALMLRDLSMHQKVAREAIDAVNAKLTAAA